MDVQEDGVELLVERLQVREEVVFDNSSVGSLDLRDAGFLVRDVWRAKSARARVPGSVGEKGLSRFVDHLHFTRYNDDAAIACNDATDICLIILFYHGKAGHRGAAWLCSITVENRDFSSCWLVLYSHHGIRVK